MKRRETGILGERIAADFLKTKGYKILEANYRCPEGEVDIVAIDGDTLVFIEVRTKTSTAFGSPEESITEAKKERLRAVSAYYQQDHDNLPQLVRIDVIAIKLDKKGKPLRIELIANAVGDD